MNPIVSHLFVLLQAIERKSLSMVRAIFGGFEALLPRPFQVLSLTHSPKQREPEALTSFHGAGVKGQGHLSQENRKGQKGSSFYDTWTLAFLSHTLIYDRNKCGKSRVTQEDVERW
ncbi:unnamed protein product [Rangifer tarandus platyrhynchus]|uniref:Uncharacterized protein n=1 Tax=Rangifer tarandus platyrhynchus TaxID=3082113 RepID=A0ABN8Z9G6_RANTA|nr:unnamed protein product [Rangifer tarandus platyrhynchus]